MYVQLINISIDIRYMVKTIVGKMVHGKILHKITTKPQFR